MVRRRGLPGSERHTALREAQAANAARPSYHALAQVVVRRLAALDQSTGSPDVDALTGPVTEAEYAESGTTFGAPVPDAIRRVVETAHRAPIAVLIERGVVPSAEVLAELVPQLVASTAARAYPDEALRRLMTAHYRAFRNRRSLLLVDLQHQVRVDELPWVQAVARHRRDGDASREGARIALGHLGELALQGFPATILPNRLVRELSTLARDAGIEVPFVEELAADIFMGRFSAKFLRAAALAGEVLRGSLYERYYDIDYAEIALLGDDLPRNDLPGDAEVSAPRRKGWGSANRDPAAEFGTLCQRRAKSAGGGAGHRWSAAGNGTVIEQAQILTTHNLAALVRPIGVEPGLCWADLAARCFTTVCRLVGLVPTQSWPMATIKDAAYAWRQLTFHLSMCGPREQAGVLAWFDDELARHPDHVAARLAPAVAGLRLVAAGGRFDGAGVADGGRARRLLGWSTDGHWLRTEPATS
ncbi:hypothetical protein GT354_24780, partial [Streptomyces sp. SID3343]|nr:hypothetical protein [Streptomyces sp. SID3343]